MNKSLPKVMLTQFYKTLLTLSFFFIIAKTARAQNVNVTATAGAIGGSYFTLKDAFDAINLGTHQGSILLEIVGNTTETATAVLSRSDSGATIYTTITIRPSGGVAREIRGNFTGSLITFLGADSVIIDGLNSGGNSLSIINDSTGLTNTIRFVEDASRNTIKNCTIRGSGTATGSAIILFGGALNNGNDSNLISYCNFDTANAGRYVNAILSAGSSFSGAENALNTIEFCNIGNFFNPSVQTNGILLSTGSVSWTIRHNKFYQQLLCTYTTANVHRGIGVLTGTNHTIQFNRVGFADTVGTGKYQMAGAVATTFVGISATFNSTGNNNISNNTISEITLTTTATTSTVNGVFAGIALNGGNATIANNSIGKNVDTASITVTAGAAAALIGINTSSTGTVLIQSNQLGALKITPTLVTAACALHAINVSGIATAITIRQNTIGNATSNNIQAGILGTTTGNSLVNGIQTPSTSTSVVIASNTIRNLVSFSTSTGTYVRGIFTNTSSSTVSTSRIDSNTIFNLTGYGALTGLTSGLAAVQGIHFSPGINSIISYNTIYNLSCSTTATTNVVVAGIAHASGTNTAIFGNRIYDLSNTAAGTTASTPGVATGIGIRSGNNTVKVYNNFITLGTGQTTNTSFVGIWANHGVTPNPIDSIVFNSVYIGGAVTSGAQPSFCFYRGDFSATARTATVGLYGNQFYNVRRGGTGGHYAISNNYQATTPSATGWAANASDRNNLYSNNLSTIGRWGGTDLTLANWRTTSSGDLNSVTNTLLIADSSIGDLHLAGASQTNANFTVPFLTDYPFDIDMQIRSGAGTQMGGDEYVLTCTAPPTADTASSSSTNTCPNEVFTLSLPGASSGLGMLYQWQISSSGISGPFTNLIGDTSAFINKSQTATNAYRCVLTCSGQSDTSAPVLVTTINTPFGGTYSIDLSAPVSVTNYHSLQDLISQMACRGITSAVTINMAASNPIFTGQLVFDSIPGASASNPVVINGNGNTISASNSIVVRFNAAKYITLDSLNIVSTSAGFGIHIWNQSQFITIQKCSINVGNTATATTSAGIVISGSLTSATTAGNNGSNISIIDNTIFGGYYGITALGNTGYVNNTNLLIRNNTISDFYFYGIYVSNGDTVLIERNNISRNTRAVVTTFYGIAQLVSRYVRAYNNSIHSSGSGNYTAYPIYITNSVNTPGFESEYINNQVYNIPTTGILYGIYSLTTALDGFRFYHNTLALTIPTASTGAVRGAFFAVAPNNTEFKNNIISISGGGSGVKTGIYLTTASSGFSSNYNVIHVGSTTSNNIGYWGAANGLTLANWTAASGQDSNSVSANPVFVNSLNPTPKSLNIDNIGIPLGITLDIIDSARSLTTPDPGAYEFTGIAGDIALLSGELIQSSASKCFSSNDTIRLNIFNNIGPTIDFSVDSLTIYWNVTGPINSNGTIVLSSGTLGSLGTLSVFSNTVDRSLPGIYSFSAFIDSNAVNVNRLNDSLSTTVTNEIKPILTVTPANATVSTSAAKVNIKASSPLFPPSGNMITEICQFRGATGAAPAGGWPSYLIADDYVELTGVAGFDLAGYTFEEWTGTTLQHSVTFPVGTVYSPSGTMILATGQLGSSAPSPANFYYHTGNTVSHASTGVVGYILKDPANNIVDAVTYGAYTFPAASGVTSADWTGSTPSVSSAGIRLNGADVNNGSNWIVESASQRQDPNIVNINVVLPVVNNPPGYSVFLNGSLISNNATDTAVGPFYTPGTYTYVFEYVTPCGTYYDTAVVTATGCVSPPNVGTATSSTTQACPSEVFSLSVPSIVNNIGITYQWQISPSGAFGSFTDLVGDTFPTINKSQVSTNYYQCIVTCSGQSDTSNTVEVITNSSSFAGTYTIDLSNPPSGTNYHSLNSLVNDMECRGVSGAVTINMAAGNPIFTTPIVIDSIPGASNLNPIVINGNGNTISSNSTIVLRFNRAKYITVDSLTLISTANGFGIHIGNQSQFIAIQKCSINVGNTSTATTCAGIVISGSLTSATAVGNNGSNISILNNTIFGGYYGIAATGNANYLNNTNLIVQNNLIQDFHLYGMYILNGDSILIERNNINRATRTALSTFYGIAQLSSRYVKVYKNSIHSSGAGSYTAYPIYITNSVNSIGSESEYINNEVYNIGTTGTLYGIYGLTTAISGFKFYHNTIALNLATGSTGAVRGVFFAVAPDNVQFRNNIVSISGIGSGVKTGIYISVDTNTFISNNNVIHVGSSTSNNIGFWDGALRTTLVDWQNASFQDLNSATLNPAFATSTNVVPKSIGIDNIGASLGIVTDILDSIRSTTTPDVGAYEFIGFSNDIALQNAQLIQSSSLKCYSANDTIKLTIFNNIGTAINFAVDSLKINWTVTGPVNSTGTITINSGSLAPLSSLTVFANSVDRSLPGAYLITAYIDSNATNASKVNDTLSLVPTIPVASILNVTPASSVVSSPTATVELLASSPLFPATGTIITEICHWRGATGAAPPGGWPAYLIADDYVELTGIPNSDLAGYTFEEWTGTTLQHTVTFPQGTIFSPSGTMILATGQLTSSVPSPANFYYHTGNTVTHSSTGVVGYILKNPNNVIVDAVTYGTYSFPLAANVTSADWTGSTPSVSSAGIRLNGADLNNGTTWVVESAAQRQNPNTTNANVPRPKVVPTSGYTVYLNGSPISTVATDTIVGPYSVPGTYEYVFEYTTACGLFRDTVVITATSGVPVSLLSFDAKPANKDVQLNWSTASETNNKGFYIERSLDAKLFETIQFIKGAGNSNRLQSYAFKDQSALKQQPVLYYRLRQVDFDGTFTYSEVKQVRAQQTTTQGITAAPNPFSNNLSILMNNDNSGDVMVTLYDLYGRKVMAQKYTTTIGNNILELNGVDNLAAGVYTATVVVDGEQTAIKLIKK